MESILVVGFFVFCVATSMLQNSKILLSKDFRGISPLLKDNDR
jgi:hypothetical protein